MKDEIETLKAAEKEALTDFVAVEKHKSAGRANNLRVGLGLIIIGAVLLAIVLSGASIWKFWWLIFFVKPLLFGWGWGWGGRGRPGGWFACDAKGEQRTG